MAEGSTIPTEIRKFIAPELVMGEHALGLVGQYAKNLGMRRALLVTDAGVVTAGWADVVAHSLEAAGVEVVVFDKVCANPDTGKVQAGAERYRTTHCHGLVAVGGGSPIDAAKGIGVVATNGGSILDYEGVDQIENPIPPLVCAPTTASSADVSQFAIVTDLERRTKFAIISKALVPDVSLMDSRTFSTMPASLAAATGLDALTHAIEAFVSNASSPLTDLVALEAVKLIVADLARFVDDRGYARGADALMQASALAGMAFSNAILGVVHALAHSLGGFLNLPHGECNAVLLEHVVRFNFDAARERYIRVAEVFGVEPRNRSDCDVRDALAEAIRRLRERLGVAGSLAAMGVKRSDFPALAQKALEDPCIATNPREVMEHDLRLILEQAY